ncbi:MAG: prepilin-type N-terminal cleavage/methylation domain-containing protein [Nitrospinae bacterium]|nr:prepilin-type N-terminal cleavage/methylation domain-containing protein [Nitrospinota bacterium]
MSSASTPLPEEHASKKKPSEAGFSLLEVIVALAIMALGFFTVMQLFSGSIRTVGLSEQYLKAVTLAHSKMGELELTSYRIDDSAGTFPDEENYRWELEISPYSSSLSNEAENIHLSEVLLRVLWKDLNKVRTIELTTVKVDGSMQPMPDSLLAQVFSGGPGSINQNEEALSEETASETSTAQNISGGLTSTTSSICGSNTVHISGN